MTSGDEGFIIERRQNTKLRSIYPDAYVCIDQFFHGQSDWVGIPVDYLAHRVVHDAYPDLSSTEVHILVTAIERNELKKRRESTNSPPL